MKKKEGEKMQHNTNTPCSMAGRMKKCLRPCDPLEGEQLPRDQLESWASGQFGDPERPNSGPLWSLQTIPDVPFRSRCRVYDREAKIPRTSEVVKHEDPSKVLVLEVGNGAKHSFNSSFVYN